MSEEQQLSGNIIDSQPQNRWKRGSFLASWMSRRQSVSEATDLDSDETQPDKQRRIKKAWSRIFKVVDMPSMASLEEQNPVMAQPTISQETLAQALDNRAEAIAQVSDEFKGELVVDHDDEIVAVQPETGPATDLSDNILEQDLAARIAKAKPATRPTNMPNLDPDINAIHEALGYQMTLDKNLFYEPEAEVAELPVIKNVLSRPVDALERNDAKESDYEHSHEAKTTLSSSPTHVGAILAKRPVGKTITPLKPQERSDYQPSQKLDQAAMNQALYSIPTANTSDFFTAQWPVQSPIITQLPEPAVVIPMSTDQPIIPGELYRKAMRYGFMAGVSVLILVIIINLLKS